MLKIPDADPMEAVVVLMVATAVVVAMVEIVVVVVVVQIVVVEIAAVDETDGRVFLLNYNINHKILANLTFPLFFLFILKSGEIR